MKLKLALILVIACGLTGCFGMGFTVSEQDAANTTRAVGLSKSSQRPASVNPDQVNDSNAHAMARALEAEMEFDARLEELPAPAR